MKSEECIMSLRKLFLNYFFIIKISCAPWVLRRDLRLRLRLSRRSSEYLNLRLIFYEMLVCKHVSIGMNGIGKLAWRMTYRLMKTIVGHDFIKSIIYGEDNYQLSIKYTFVYFSPTACSLYSRITFSRQATPRPSSVST